MRASEMPSWSAWMIERANGRRLRRRRARSAKFLSAAERLSPIRISWSTSRDLLDQRALHPLGQLARARRRSRGRPRPRRTAGRARWAAAPSCPPCGAAHPAVDDRSPGAMKRDGADRRGRSGDPERRAGCRRQQHDEAEERARRPTRPPLSGQVHLRRHRCARPAAIRRRVDLVRDPSCGRSFMGDVGDLLVQRADDAVVHAACELSISRWSRVAVALGLAQRRWRSRAA